ncbi:hypothetical protein EDC01DRAFT_756892 [Geopyxis carbonaria]|nr:hypothetical protein EDC01DRAFT_756892 [Geopyxis carbonaria]
MAITPESALAVCTLCLLLPSGLFLHRLLFELVYNCGPPPSGWSRASLAFAAAAWLSLAANYGMEVWSQHLALTERRHADSPLFIARVGVRVSSYAALMQAIIFGNLLLATSIWMVKASFMCLYFQFPRAALTRGLRTTLYIASAGVAASYVGVIIPYFTACRPFSEAWSVARSAAGTNCNPTDFIANPRWLYVHTALNTASDAVVIGLPLVIITRSLTLTRYDRTAFAFVLMLGVLTVAVTVARAALLMRVTSWTPETIVTSQVLAFAEGSMALCCVCLPAVRAAVKGRSDERRRRGEVEGGRKRGARKLWERVGERGVDV